MLNFVQSREMSKKAPSINYSFNLVNRAKLGYKTKLKSWKCLFDKKCGEIRLRINLLQIFEKYGNMLLNYRCI